MKALLEEKHLLYRIHTKKDPEAYGELYDRYVKRIYRFIYFKVSSHDEAEDLTSEVFLKTWHYLTEHSPIDHFSGLIYRIARTTIIDYYRLRAKRVEVSSHDAEGLEDGGVLEISDLGRMTRELGVAQDAQKLISLLERMKEEYREIITFRYIDELSIEEIAGILHKSKTGVRVTIHRALKVLRKLFEDQE